MKNKFQNYFEFMVVSIAIYLLWTFYVPIGTLTSFKGVNNAHLTFFPWDNLISFCPYPVTAYGIAFILVPLAIFFSIINLYKDQNAIRAFYLAFFLLILICFVIFWFFPTSVITFRGIPQEVYKESFLNAQVLETYQRVSPWNSFPSMHIATGWLCLRMVFFAFNNKVVKYSYLIWFLMMMLGTVSLMYHSILDGVAGFIIAEVVFRLCINYKDNFSKQYKQIPYSIRIGFFLVVIVTQSYILNLAIESQLFKFTL